MYRYILIYTQVLVLAFKIHHAILFEYILAQDTSTLWHSPVVRVAVHGCLAFQIQVRKSEMCSCRELQAHLGLKSDKDWETSVLM